MAVIKEQLKKLPVSPGVYLFLAKGKSASGGKDKTGKIIYIGKATNLKSRVSSYFSGPHDAKTEKMVSQIIKIDYQKTSSVLEALILEANLIKKYQPKYNVKLKDDKSFCYFIVTKEEFPRILILRKTDLKLNRMSFPRKRESRFRIKPGMTYEIKIKNIYGPYTSRKQMEIALQIIRKIFPFHSLNQKTEKGCLDAQIGLCPGPYDGRISKNDYQSTIRKIELFLSGKKKKIILEFKKEMKKYSSHQEFEKAAEIRNKIFALNHIQDIALISAGDENFQFSIFNFQNKYEKNIPHRIEAYDISNIFGQFATGSMAVFIDGQIEKSEYRKFKIKTVQGANDVGMIKEVLKRRFRHKEWELPNLIFIDGGAGQFNAALNVLLEENLKIPVCALAKGPTRKGEKLFLSAPLKIKINLIKEIRDEAHRFAISYHRLLRKKGLP